MSKHIVAALQLGSEMEGKAKTLEKILSYEAELIEKKVELVVMPEALLGGYPKGEIFGTYMGYRTDEGREKFLQYWQNSIDIPGPETDQLAAMAKRTGTFMVVGCIERTQHALYCTALFIDPVKGLVAKHRKTMPTAEERLVWGMGDGSTLSVVDSQVGRVGACICWENYMPLQRAYMYSQDLEIYCAPTVDARDVWQHAMHHIGHEGRCFVISCCQYEPSPETLGIEVPHWDPKVDLIRGGAVIVGPQGNTIAGPVYGKECLLVAEIEKDDLIRARYDIDVSGHYSRPDIFSLKVDTRRKLNVETTETPCCGKTCAAAKTDAATDDSSE